ncbi:MAG: hypothetical protein KIS78_33880, partial [Labilithrix sp.]|nr:hypothetical protein [Labilithrix sp.]
RGSCRARSCLRGLAFLAPIAIAAPASCADSGVEREPEADRAPDATVLPDAPPSDGGPPVADASSDVVVDARCSPGGFCYEALPVPVPLVGVSATSMDHAWAVGGDVIVRWDGASWKPAYRYDGATSGTAVTLRAVFVAKADDVWAVGATPFPDRRFFVVRRSQGDGGAPAFRETLTEEPVVGDFWAGWLAPGSDALWLVEAGTGSVLRFREAADGGVATDRWRPQGEPEDGAFYAWYGLWGFGADVYVSGTACSFGSCTNLVARYDGESWSTSTFEDPKIVTGMFGTRDLGQPKHLWLELLDSATGARSVRLVPLSSDGGLGAPVVERALSGCGSFVGSAADPGAAWLSDGCLVHRWNGATLEVTPIAVGGEPPGRVNAVWAGSADDAWVVGASLPYQGPNVPELGFAARREGKWAADGGEP